LKIKTLMIFLNILMLFFIALIFILPLAALGKALAMDFFRDCWYLAPLVLAVLVLIDCYFVVNYRVYVLLEKEDWPALVQELEQRVIRKGRYNGRLVKLLAASYLVISDARSVTELERKLAIAKPRLVNDNALIFGAARVLSRDYQGAVEFFGSRISGKLSGRGRDRAEWLRWYFGFSLLLARRFEEAADCFMLLAREGRNGILAGLSSYFLEETLAPFLPRRKELRGEAAEGRTRVRKELKTRSDWEKELKPVKNEVYAVVLLSYITKAENYLYQEKT